MGGLFVNVGEFAEFSLTWTVEIVGALVTAILGSGALTVVPTNDSGQQLDQLWQRLHESCVALARVGAYPLRSGPQGLPAAPSFHRGVMARRHASRLREGKRGDPPAGAG